MLQCFSGIPMKSNPLHYLQKYNEFEGLNIYFFNMVLLQFEPRGEAEIGSSLFKSATFCKCRNAS